MPKFWHDVEATKSEDNLRTVLDKLWKQIMDNMDKHAYKIYWADVMVKAIRVVKLMASDEGRYMIWKTKVTPQNFKPRTIDQMTYMDNLRERKELARGNRTMEDLEKEKKSKVTRVLPTTMAESQKGLCTYTNFLAMMMDVRRAFNKLSTRKETIKP